MSFLVLRQPFNRLRNEPNPFFSYPFLKRMPVLLPSRRSHVFMVLCHLISQNIRNIHLAIEACLGVPINEKGERPGFDPPTLGAVGRQISLLDHDAPP